MSQNKNYAAGKWRGIFSTIITSLLLPALAATAQERTSDGVRSGAMGGAYMGVSDDANGIRFNPSGAVYSPEDWILEFSTENLFGSSWWQPLKNDLINEGNVTLSSIGGVRNFLEKPNRTQPVLAMAGRETPVSPNNGQQMPTHNKFSVGAMINFLDSGLLHEWSLRAFVSKGFFEKREPLPEIKHRPHLLALSVTGKFWRYEYASDIAERAQVNSEIEREAIRSFFGQNGDSKNGFGLDVGATLNPHPRVRVGASLLNLVQPDIGLASASRFPRNFRAGAAVRLKPEWEWLLAADMDFDLDVDMAKQVKPDTMNFFIGSEINLLKAFNQASEILKLRAGANRDWISAGFRLAVFPINVNYAFLHFLHDNGLYNHRVSLSYAWRRPQTNGSNHR